MLYLVGLGIEKGDLTLKGKQALDSADEIYFEDYTSFPYDVDYKTTLLPRSDTESNILIEKAKDKIIVLLVGGDPLFATTHISLVQEGKKQGIEVKVIHAPSIINVICRTGLSPYKFGRIVTLSQEYESDKEKITKNIENEMHTLCLIDPEIKANRAIEVLRTMGFNQKLVVCGRLGSETEKIHYGSEFESVQFGDSPHCIVIPGKLHFFEDEFLQQFSLNA